MEGWKYGSISLVITLDKERRKIIDDKYHILRFLLKIMVLILVRERGN